jgi:hypothetical protein
MFAVAFSACDDDDDGDNGDNTPAAGETAPAGNGDGDEAALEQTVRDALAAWNASDAEGVLSYFTDQGAIESFGEEGSTIEEVRQFLPQFIGEPIEPSEFEDTSVDGDTGETTVTWINGNAYEKLKFLFINEAGEWKIDGQEDLVVDIPDDATTIDVTLNDFSFTYDTAAAAEGGLLAFAAENEGEQPHEVALARIPADADINELLESEEEPAGVEFLGGAAAEPGDSVNLVFAEPLTPGRYLVACFLPDTSDPEGTPHAYLGMVSEFTVE